MTMSDQLPPLVDGWTWQHNDYTGAWEVVSDESTPVFWVSDEFLANGARAIEFVKASLEDMGLLVAGNDESPRH